MKTFKVFENITEVISWLQIVASPTLFCCGIGAFIYFRKPNLTNLIITICICMVGLISGILYANKIWKTKGTVWFMSRVNASPELDNQDSKKNLKNEETKLYKSIDEILWNDWDPIGVNDFGENARDEYYGYLPIVYQLKINGATKTEIANYLDLVMTDRMEMSSNMEHSLNVAEKIVYLNHLKAKY